MLGTKRAHTVRVQYMSNTPEGFIESTTENVLVTYLSNMSLQDCNALIIRAVVFVYRYDTKPQRSIDFMIPFQSVFIWTEIKAVLFLVISFIIGYPVLNIFFSLKSVILVCRWSDTVTSSIHLRKFELIYESRWKTNKN